MGGKWRLSNPKKQKGMLGKTSRFTGPGPGLEAASISIPLESDEGAIRHAAAGLASGTIRSMEMWWDGERKELMMVMVAIHDDMPIFKQSFLNLYPAARFTDLEGHTPKWFDERIPYDIFDAELYHGHFASIFEEGEARWAISNLANTIQKSRFAWIQFVFCKRDFTQFLNGHLQRLNAHHRAIQKNKLGSGILEGLRPQFGAPKEEREHEETTGDFETHHSILEQDATTKMQGPHVMVSVRGLVDPGIISDISVIESMPFESIRSGYDYLTTHRYRHDSFFRHDLDKADYITVEQQATTRQRISMFPDRLMPDMKECGLPIRDNYTRKRMMMMMMMGGYKPRQSPPFLIALPQELPWFLRLPKPSTPNICTTRGSIIPSQQLDKSGFCIGYFEPPKSFDSVKYYGRYGREHISSDIDGVTISKTDFPYHVYVPGGTGSGKSSIIKAIAKNLEMANFYWSLPRSVPVRQIPCNTEARELLAGLDQDKTLDQLGVGWPNAFVYFDPKGDDSELFVRQCQRSAIYGSRVHYLDPIKTRFSINPLELPAYNKDVEGEREYVVSQYVGYFFEMIDAWYGNSDTFVRMKRIMYNLLSYLYVHQDKPTFRDMYEIILKIQADKKRYLPVIYSSLGKPGDELDSALTSIAGMDAKSFEPVLHRLEKFVVDPTLNHMFCQRKSTVNFRDLIKAGNYTVVRFSESDIPLDSIDLAMQTFVMKLWFEVLNRSTTESLKEHTQVILALDEFQKMKDISVLETMISQARSKGLGLVLAHQSLKQLNPNDLSIITTNFGIQMAGHLEGEDAQRLANAWDPNYANDIKNMISTQAKYHWTVRISPKAMEEQPLPVQFWTMFDPESDEVCRSNMSNAEWDAFVTAQRESYGSKDDGMSLFDAREEERNLWKKNIDVLVPPRGYWHVILIMQDQIMGLGEITKLYNPGNNPVVGTTSRDHISKLLAGMLKDGLVAKEDGRKGRYSLTAKAQGMVRFRSREIGTAGDVKEVMRHAVRYYLNKGYFLAMAGQTVRKGQNRTDMVAYDYATDTPISVEIESEAEGKSHLEHVRFNMMKWPELGFRKCHMWSFYSKIGQEYENMKEGKIKANTQIFILDKGDRPMRVIPPDDAPSDSD